MPKPMTLTAVKSITLTGLLASGDPMLFTRVTSPSSGKDRPFGYDIPRLWDPRFDPEKGTPPNGDHPPFAGMVGECTLNLALGDQLGSGRSGFVNAVRVTDSSGTDEMLVPPMAIKLGLQYQRMMVMREAWFYDDLVELQGSVIPRCYGYFEAEVPDGEQFLVSEHGEKHAHRPAHLDVDPIPGFRANRIGVLLLERLSSKTIGSEPATAEERSEILYALFRPLSDRFVRYQDFSGDNILRVSESDELPHPPTSESQVSPWRIIDLEGCMKHCLGTDRTWEKHYMPRIDILTHVDLA